MNIQAAQKLCKDGLFSKIPEPAVLIRPPLPVHNNPHEEKKITRIIRDLSRDLAKKNPDTPLPSTWLIRCLVKSYCCRPLGTNWRSTISWTLAHIAAFSNPENSNEGHFVELDGTTPLFPNSEEFTLKDTYLLAQSLLKYLERQSATFA